jgi:tetratricopeptide (TPR) repeat protein
MATVKDRSVFVAVDSDLSFSQLFFPVKGILAWYDRETKAFGALGGADNPDLVQSNPVWNHDGSVITFARAPKYDLNKLKDENAAVLSKEEVAEFLTGGKDMKFDLYRVPFNEGKGGEALPIPGAAANGKSNFFPRYSPDGKWMVFCQATSFMLLQPDSMLYIMPAAGGTPRKMTCNRPLMNSWHSWSSNSRWLVFSSKPNGPYTQLFLTHIDEDGNDSPPVLLEHFTAPDRAANIPEFVKLHPDAIKKIEVNFLDETSYFRAAMAFMPFDGEVRTREDYQNAVVAYARSVELDPKNPMVRSEYGLALVAVGRSEEALEQWQQASKLAPDYPDPLFNIALLYSQEGREAEAITLFKKVLELDDKFMEANLSLGSVYFKQGRTQEALAQWEAALKTKPEWQKALYNIGLLKMHGGRFDEARDYYLRSTVADPTHLESQLGLGLVLYISGRTDEGIKRLEDALEQIPNEPALMDLLSIGYARSGDFKSAESLSGKALEQAKARENQKLSADIAAHLAVIKKGQVPGL